MDKSITHKELLTFTNVTNLSWEFANLNPVEREDQDGNTYYEYPQLNDLLTPEVFARRDAEKDIEEFVYMKDADTTDIDQLREDDMEQGRIQLRQEAGIAMEYCLRADNKEWRIENS